MNFVGGFDPNVYEEWNRKINQIVFCYELLDLDIIRPSKRDTGRVEVN